MIKALNLENAGGMALQETLEHPAFIRKITGIDPFERPTEAMLAAAKALGFDWMFGVPKRAVKFAEGEGKKTLGGGHYVTEWGFSGSHWSEHEGFDDIEKALEYDPFDGDESGGAVRARAKSAVAGVEADQAACGDLAVVTGLYYTTLFQWPIMAFGWETFLAAAASEPERFAVLLGSFARASRIYAEEYAASKIPFFFCHDDLAMTRGLVFAPEWYRKNIFPWYEYILDPVFASGKKAVFVSDGNYAELLDDLFAAGFSGVMVDWTFDLARLIRKYGDKKLVAGNADTMVLTFGTPDDVRKEVRRCADAARGAPGYVMKCSNDLPQNILLENIEAYFDEIAEQRARG